MNISISVSRQSATLSFATQHTMPSKFGGKWGMECLSTRFSLPTLLCARYTVKLILINLIWYRSKERRWVAPVYIVTVETYQIHVFNDILFIKPRFMYKGEWYNLFSQNVNRRSIPYPAHIRAEGTVVLKHSVSTFRLIFEILLDK